MRWTLVAMGLWFSLGACAQAGEANAPDARARGMDGGVDPFPPCMKGCPDSGEGFPDLPFPDLTPGGDGGSGAPMELCGDGLDNDGDGAVDEGCACAVGAVQRCFPGDPARAGVGLCTWGMQSCDGTGVEGTWSACRGAVAPATETCDGMDNDCDGSTDEDCPCPAAGMVRGCYSGPTGTEGRGACRAGRQLCLARGAATTWGPCEGFVLPVPERCDGTDTDCDGNPRNNCNCTPGMSRPCGDGPGGAMAMGACRAGTSTCNTLPGGGADWSTCTGGALPGPEDCSSTADRNCDGRTGCSDPECAGNPSCVRCMRGTVALLEPRRARVVVLVDRSGSMGARTPDGATRWGAVRSALSRTLPVLNDALDLGLNLFPIDNGCGVNTGMITVPVRTSNAAAVNTVLGYFAPGGNTPTQSALQATHAWLMANSSMLPRYVILATDGEPTCGQRLSNVTEQLAAMNASGTPTFVLGIPGSSASLRAALQAMALAGGRPRTGGGTAWYEANDTMELVTALRAIAATGTECTYPVTLTVTNPALLRVQFNGMDVPMDGTHGWTFAGGSVQFHGESCNRLRTGSVINITALYNCS